MVSQLLLQLLAVSVPVFAGPLPHWGDGWQWMKRAPLAFPLNGLQDPATLSPSSHLKVVTLGIGHQNYSCASPDQAPVSIGATATLFDVQSFLQANGALIPWLPGMALSASGLQSDVKVAQTSVAADQADFNIGSNIPVLQQAKIGHHFFDAGKSPNFILDGEHNNLLLVAKKLGDVPAPAGSTPGPGNIKAVDWLLLGDSGVGRSVGLDYVYRVETSGGSPPATCAGVAPGSFIRVPYTAEYWFYAPS
jgi:hypothetical protein